MRLINSSTLELEEFYGDAIPPYAILSHRWLDDEVSLQDLQSDRATSKAGYAKIEQCCAQALRDGLTHAWVDTCCIDKTSSAELTEAINSMYAWYRDADVCYAYLSDVTASALSPDDTSFDESVWFTRGWTLQELLAPSSVLFYNASWSPLGARDDEALTARIAAATGIDMGVLRGDVPLHERSVAQRMSWAASRTTTRVEDRAYSLLGLFGVNMPMLYGEGTRAFLRLQEEIMQRSDDQSLFAWSRDGLAGEDDADMPTGLLATSPACFASCGDVVVAGTKWNHQPYSLTNLGLSLEMPMAPWAMETLLAVLDCEVENAGADRRVGIYLRMQEEDGQYLRVRFDGGAGASDVVRNGSALDLAQKVKYRKIYVRQVDRAPTRRAKKTATLATAAASTTTTLTLNPAAGSNTIAAPAEPTSVYGFFIRSLPYKLVTATDPADPSYPLSEVTTVRGGTAWSDTDRIVTLPPGAGGTVAAIWLCSPSRSYAVKVGFDDDFNPVVQYGGQLYSPVRPPIPPQSEEAMLHPSWMAVRHSDYLFRGDRVRGLQHDGYPWRISLSWEVVGGNRKMWVLDIADT